MRRDLETVRVTAHAIRARRDKDQHAAPTDKPNPEAEATKSAGMSVLRRARYS